MDDENLRYTAHINREASVCSNRSELNSNASASYRSEVDSSVASISYLYDDDDEISTGLSCSSFQYALTNPPNYDIVSRTSTPSDEEGETFSLNPPPSSGEYDRGSTSSATNRCPPSLSSNGSMTIDNHGISSEMSTPLGQHSSYLDSPVHTDGVTTGYLDTTLKTDNAAASFVMDSPLMTNNPGADVTMLPVNKSHPLKCIPSWISDAAPAIKFIIIASTALLVGSSVLVAFAFLGDGNRRSDLQRNSGSNALPTSPVSVPVVIPTPTPSTFPSPTTVKILTDSPSFDTSKLPTIDPTIQLTISQTLQPTQNPIPFPTMNPTINRTIGPTPLLTLNPTNSPTTQPTTSPSWSPTNPSTVQPTPLPTRSPTRQATPLPTRSPTRQATPMPTRSSTVQSTTYPTPGPTKKTTIFPSLAPTINPTIGPIRVPTWSPTNPPITHPILSPTHGPTKKSTPYPTLAHTIHRTVRPEPSPGPVIPPTTGRIHTQTPMPIVHSLRAPVDSTLLQEDSQTIFYLFSKNLATRGRGERITDFKVEADSRFLFHLGNWRRRNRTLCTEDEYERFVKKIKRSVIPFFVLPGQNEWERCENYEYSRELWRKHLVGLEDQWSLSFNVSRQEVRPENFSFIQRKILFIGLNMVPGVRDDLDRVKNNIDWVNENVAVSKENVATVFILGSVGNYGAENSLFFDELKGEVKEWNSNGQKLTVVYVKQSARESNSYQSRNNGLITLNFQANVWPPMNVTANYSEQRIKFVDSISEIMINMIN